MQAAQKTLPFRPPNDGAIDNLRLILEDIAGGLLSPSQSSVLVTAAAGALAAMASAPPPDPPSSPVPVEDRLQVDRKEAACRLGYSPTMIDRLVERGLLRPNRATGRPKFSVKELERFVKEGISIA
jgi:hypothetical protein